MELRRPAELLRRLRRVRRACTMPPLSGERVTARYTPPKESVAGPVSTSGQFISFGAGAAPNRSGGVATSASPEARLPPDWYRGEENAMPEKRVQHQQPPQKIRPRSHNGINDIEDKANNGGYLTRQDGQQRLMHDLKRVIHHSQAKDVVDKAIRVAARNGLADYAEELLALVVDPTNRHYTTVMSGFAAKGDMAGVRRVWVAMRKARVPASKATYNVALNCLAANQEMDKAKELLGKMQADGYPPDLVSFNTVIKSCTDVSEALALQREAINRNFNPDAYTLEALLVCCRKCEDEEAAELCLADLASRGVRPNELCYLQLLKMKGDRKDLAGTLGLVQEMNAAQIKMNHHIVECVLQTLVPHVKSRSSKLMGLVEALSQRSVRTHAIQSLVAQAERQCT